MGRAQDTRGAGRKDQQGHHNEYQNGSAESPAPQQTADGVERPVQGLKQANENLYQSTDLGASKGCAQRLQWSIPRVEIATNQHRCLVMNVILCGYW